MLAATQGPRVDWVRGDETGLLIPAHAGALVEGSAEFLTRGFRRFGSLAPDNQVAGIERIEACPGGSTGSKLFLTVSYRRDEPGLARELFVKFSRDFADERRDRQRFEMAGEARFAAVSRLPGFPIEVPEAYFADFHAESGTGLVITRRVAFGEQGIEPHRRKCMDHVTLPEPLPYYRAMVTALAKLAASHKSGALSPDIETRFPFDPGHGSADPIRFDVRGLQEELARCRAFAEQCPQLLPAEVRSPEFHEQMARDALRVLEHREAIDRYLVGNPDLIALNHWNAHIDNCFFWRDDEQRLHCGLIDWGRAAQITFGAALWGCLSAAHHEIWDRHLDDLLALFSTEYASGGGRWVPPEELKLHLALHMAAMGVARCLAFPEVVLFRLPEAVHATGPLDPMFEAVDPARNSLHIYTVLLKFWRRIDFGAQLDAMLARTGSAQP